MAARRPLIGIPADRRMLGSQPYHLAGEKYVTAALDAAGAIPVYRLYNNRFAFTDSNHRFTTQSANVTYSIKTAPPLNRCGEKPATQRILLKNIGLSPAKTFILELQPLVYRKYGRHLMNNHY